MQWSELNDEQMTLVQWWKDRLGGEENLLRWTDLTHKQQVLLIAWYILTIAEPPSHREELPVDLRKALAELARLNCHRDHRFLRQRITTGLPANKRRIVRVRKKRHRLA